MGGHEDGTGYPGGSDGKESTWNVGNLGLILELGGIPGGGNGKPLQYSCLENPHGQRNLAGYSLLSHKESDMTEQPSMHIWRWDGPTSWMNERWTNISHAIKKYESKVKEITNF